MRSLLPACTPYGAISRVIKPLVGSLLIFTTSPGQTKSQNVFTDDIDHFWIAFDSIRATTDTARQVQLIKTLYIDKGSEGVKAFMQLRDYSAEKWVKLINNSPKFWTSIRPNTLAVKQKAPLIQSSIRRFKELYPELTEAKMYFTIGGLNSGGTTMNDMILIGAEIATGTADVDVSDLSPGTSRWLGAVFKEQHLDNIVPLNIHEYVHTQQKGAPAYLLGQCIKEGSCDFITELVLGKPLQNNYIKYGQQREKKLAEQFKIEMFTKRYQNWLYNGSTSKTVGDLGYFMGYAICKSYYDKSADKKQAIQEIIQLNYADTNAVEHFLVKSKFYNQPLDKVALRSRFESERPYVVSIQPLKAGDSTINADVKELRIVFSAVMDGESVSISRATMRKDAYPIVDGVGFSPDKTSYTLKVNLQPGHEYEFLITDLGFKSASGYPVKPYHVRFRTP